MRSSEASDIKWHVTIMVGLLVLVIGLDSYRMGQQVAQCCPVAASKNIL